jgi:hypothetical protein
VNSSPPSATAQACTAGDWCGRSQELVVPIAVVLMSLNNYWIQKIQPEWQQYVGALVPPLSTNVSRGMAAQMPVLLQSGAYLAVVLGLGDFWYREFVRE